MLTTAEQNAIDQFSGEGFKRLARPPQGRIYHYTDGAGLVGIITSQRMRAGHIAFLNDASELRHSIQAMHNVTVQRAAQCSDPDTVAFLTGLDMALVDPLDDPYELAAIWVACYSEHNDQLSQWRGYGGAEAGYAIEFDAIRLATIAPGQNAVLVPCVYDRTIYDPVICDAVRLLEEIYTSGRGRFSQADRPAFGTALFERMVFNLSWLAPMIKHHAFSEEAEWRVFTRTPDGDVSRIRFAAKRSMIAGYIEFDLRSPTETGPGLLPVTGIVIGPSRNRSLSRAAIRAMLKKVGYQDMPVIFSEAPFRTD